MKATDDTLLRRASLFQFLSDDHFEKLRALLQEQHYEFGDIIVRQGEAADAFYILLSGRARVVKADQNGTEVVLASLKPGDSFGEAACDVRIICATNCSLRDRVRQGKFREDLFHRLNGLTLLIPSLRARSEELPALIAAELKASARNEGKKITAIHPAAMEKLLTYEWPGNLRELNHTVRTMTLFCDGRVILPEHVVFPPDLKASEPEPSAPPAPSAPENETETSPDEFSLARALRRHVDAVYEQSGRNQRQTARLLGISRATLARHLRKMAQK